MISIIVSLLVAGIAGWLTGKIMNVDGNMVLNVISVSLWRIGVPDCAIGEYFCLFLMLNPITGQIILRLYILKMLERILCL